MESMNSENATTTEVTVERQDDCRSRSFNCYPHDVFEDMESRLTIEEHRTPRVVVVNECHDGQYSFAELANDGATGDTTLVGVVLRPIADRIRRGELAGVLTVDGISYAFVFGKFRG